MSDYQLQPSGVTRNSDGAYIPNDIRNNDWQAYLTWLTSGGIPDPISVVVVSTPQQRLAMVTAMSATDKAALLNQVLANYIP